MAVLAGIDCFTVEVLTWRGLVTYYVLFFVHLDSRRVSVAGMTRNPDAQHGSAADLCYFELRGRWADR
jgi:hypothetical protein